MIKQEAITINTTRAAEIICDICGAPIKKDSFGNFYDHVHIEKQWGYLSGKDGEFDALDICEDCFDKIKNSIKK